MFFNHPACIGVAQFVKGLRSHLGFGASVIKGPLLVGLSPPFAILALVKNLWPSSVNTTWRGFPDLLTVVGFGWTEMTGLPDSTSHKLDKSENAKIKPD